MDNYEIRKNASIAFFNANNAAVSIMAAVISKTDGLGLDGASLDNVMKTISVMRSQFIGEFNSYNDKVLSKVGSTPANEEVQMIIDKVATIDNVNALQNYWIDQRVGIRDDMTVRRAFNEKKAELTGEAIINVD